ncbi:hypothetical protein K1719_041781 [Acacia pycnantha]|nr:hypothetical protein K1719_041781 [Acacia pycnantha]
MLLSNGSFFPVQFTLFGCGGTTSGISLSHKITDLATFLALIQSWTATCQGAKEPYVPDLSLAACLLPPREIPGLYASLNIAAADKLTTRRFAFSASMVGELKRRVETALGKDKDHDDDDDHHQFRPSRVEVVLAFIWRCAMLSHRYETGSFKPSVLFQGVNLRS